MYNKKIIIIIILAFVIFFSSAALIFALKIKSGNNSIAVGNSGNKATGDEALANILEQLKNNNPGYSDAQLKFYAGAAAQKTASACYGRTDENDCVSSTAFIIGNINFCHSVSNENEKLYSECISGTIKRTASAKIGQCQLLSGDDYYNCLAAIFDIDNAEMDCAGLLDTGARAICEDFFNYQAAYVKYDRELCKTIRTEKLNEYCLKVIIDKNQDTDGDGLTDLDEINKYKTNYLFVDTDGDGINDGEEVKNGFDSNGSDKLNIK